MRKKKRTPHRTTSQGVADGLVLAFLVHNKESKDKPICHSLRSLPKTSRNCTIRCVPVREQKSCKCQCHLGLVGNQCRWCVEAPEGIRCLSNIMCERCAGCVLFLLHVVNVISAFSKCYPVNDQQYCFYTDGSVLSWDDAREFCGNLGATLPIITDEDIGNVFQRFISDSNNVTVNGSDMTDSNNYVWLDAHAQHVNDSSQLHWINGQPSG